WPETPPTSRLHASSEYSLVGSPWAMRASRHWPIIRPFSQFVVLTSRFQRPTNGCDATTSESLRGGSSATISIGGSSVVVEFTESHPAEKFGTLPRRGRGVSSGKGSSSPSAGKPPAE